MLTVHEKGWRRTDNAEGEAVGEGGHDDIGRRCEGHRRHVQAGAANEAEDHTADELGQQRRGDLPQQSQKRLGCRQASCVNSGVLPAHACVLETVIEEHCPYKFGDVRIFVKYLYQHMLAMRRVKPPAVQCPRRMHMGCNCTQRQSAATAHLGSAEHAIRGLQEARHGDLFFVWSWVELGV